MKWFEFNDSLDPEPLRYFMATNEDLGGINPATLNMGRRFKDWDPNVRIWSEQSRTDHQPFDVLWNVFSIPTFSRRLQQTLQSEDVGVNDIQFLPVRVFQSTGEEIHGYAFANIVSLIESLDPSKCFLYEEDAETIDPETGKPKATFAKPALLAKPLDGHDIIRLKEAFPWIFVSDRFANVLKKGKFTGYTLRPIAVS